ncbi:tetratricopeptide repeat protein [Roseateles cavernae]|uniref:tetratricopeptide repeat protein n=1 Tax=Roseateles cavernae TaxID=3153578 RepID=UPI0032E425A9
MKLHDRHGLALSSSNSDSAAAYDAALDLFHSWRLDPLALLAPVLADDPDFIAGHLLQASVMLSAFEFSLFAAAGDSLRLAAASRHTATARERSLLAALQAWAAGDIDAGLSALDHHLVSHPRDLLALQLAHLGDLVLGRTTMLRDRIARVLGHWSESDSGYGYLLGMLAFGLEETCAFEQAEAVGRRAVELQPHDAWAVHAVAHVCEMQGRPADGLQWLMATRADWRHDNGMAVHNHWHLALMQLARGEHAAALAMYDETVAPGPEVLSLNLADASSLLWRLQLRGVEPGARWTALAQRWQAQGVWGGSAFLDLHAAMAFVSAGDRAGLQALRQAAIGAAAGPGGESVWRRLALPAIDGFAALLDGKPVRCTELLLPLLPATQPMGGSHAQRQVLLLTAQEAARRSGQQALAAALAAEQSVHGSRVLPSRHIGTPAGTNRALASA